MSTQARGIKKIIKKRQGSTYKHLLPKCLSLKKDLATPLELAPRMGDRLRQRRLRENNSTNGKVTGFPFNKGTRALLTATANNGGVRVRSVSASMWASKSSPISVQSQTKDPKWETIVHRRDSFEHHVSASACAVCAGVLTQDCSCGASLLSTMNLKEFTDACSFIRDSRTPVLASTDPRDQRQLQQAMSETVARVRETDQKLIAILRLCLYLSLVGKTDSVETVGPCCLSGDWGAMRLALQKMPPGAIFRGGQRPYAGGTAGLPAAIATLDRLDVQYGKTLCDALRRWTSAASSSLRARAVWDFVEAVASVPVPEFGSYRQKRFLEVVMLAGMAGLGGFHCNDGDFNFASGVFPIACNTETAVRTMFPAASSRALQRQGIRALQRALSHCGRTIAFDRLCALLCFWMKNKTGSISWRPA